MSELITALLAYPTVVYTGLMGVVLLYWMFVILGALDIDMFDADADGLFEGADGALDGADGALDGADGVFDGADGALDGADGALDGADGVFDGADGALDGADGIDLDADAAMEGATGLLAALNLRRAPVTITFSFIVLFSWIMTYLTMSYGGAAMAASLPTWLVGTLIMVGAFVLSLPLTSLATKPLEPVFKTVKGKSRKDYVGSVCRIRTGRADGDFGQANVELDHDHLVIPVRIDTGTLKRGQKALIIDYDAEREAYVVAAFDELMADEAAEKRKLRTP